MRSASPKRVPGAACREVELTGLHHENRGVTRWKSNPIVVAGLRHQLFEMTGMNRRVGEETHGEIAGGGDKLHTRVAPCSTGEGKEQEAGEDEGKESRHGGEGVRLRDSFLAAFSA